MSIRNSTVGIANMLMQTSATHLFVGEGDSLQNSAKVANDEMRSKGRGVVTLNMPGLRRSISSQSYRI